MPQPSNPPTARAQAAAFHSGAVRAADAVQGVLDRIAAVDGELRAFVEVWADDARAAAEAQDRARARGARLGPLAGVAIAIKDNLLLQGRIAACGSRMLESFRAPFTATAVQRALDAGAIAIGRTNMDEFGMGSSTSTSVFGRTRNPWDPTRTPGGSSGGSAAAVAADLCALALGTDTGGSVRQPAALCGVTGLKPTYGRVSRHGLVAYASSLDCIGAIARTADDLGLWLAAVAGADPFDATCSAAPVPDLTGAAVDGDLRGLRIGVPQELLALDIDAAVQVPVDAALAALRALGAELVPCRLPHLEHAVATYYLIAAAEASSNLARYDGVHFGRRSAAARTLDELQVQSRSEGFGSEVQLRILLGTFALQAGYQDEVHGQATRVRALLQRDFRAALAGCDAIACATAPAPAWPLDGPRRDPLAIYRADALTVPASLCGLPALSLPCGFADAAAAAPPLPVGLQLIGAPLREDLLLRVGRAFQHRTDWHQRRPQA
ncbi:MAG: Asp-tRNA(Asn)/Glu-tRNA(Gln) amidotransferase subunit GatA [Planctomycetota bacterium]